MFIRRFRQKSSMNRINLFLLHLAVADLMVTFLMMPMEVRFIKAFHLLILCKYDRETSSTFELSRIKKILFIFIITNIGTITFIVPCQINLFPAVN